MTITATLAIGEFSPCPSFYRGEQYDPDLGLYYLRARYYNPATGRFMCERSGRGNQLDPKTLHKYLYADGDPVNLRDPSGRDSILETGAIDDDFVLETLPKVVAYGCAVIEIWAFDAELANLVLHWATGKSKDDFWPTPPALLDLACAVPGVWAAQREFALLFAGGE